MKIPLLMGFFVLCIAVVSAEDVVLTTNNINYIIKNISSDYYVDGDYFFLDDTRFLFATQGGSFDVTFYGDSKIGLQSNVPQRINFDIRQDKNSLSLFDGSSYYLDSYNIGMEPVNLTYKKAGSISAPEEQEEEKFFLFQKFFEVEYTSVEKNGIIQGENFTITYFGLMIFVLLLLGLMVVLNRWT